MKINENYRSLEESYLFSKISAKVTEYKRLNPNSDIISLGIGDVTLPLPETVVRSFCDGAAEMAEKSTFHGYGPEQGYPFLRDAVKKYYSEIGAEIDSDDIFISDGAKSDVGNFTDLFDKDNTVLIPDPVYPVYRDTNLMNGRKIVYMSADESNGFLPMPDDTQKADIIYLCSPNNPTGAAYNFIQLEKWVEYALKNDAVILFDAAYEAFISDPKIPRSIFQIKNAESCAVEFCSLSKTAGFTGTRCGYTVVPGNLERNGMSLKKMWLRRQTTKFNGVSYPVQRAAAAVFTDDGRTACRKNIEYYRNNAEIITHTLDKLKISYTGGKNSPYVWMKCPNKMSSWEFFDLLLEKANVVGTPGSGFGKNGEGYFRLTSFGTMDNTKKAMERFERICY